MSHFKLIQLSTEPIKRSLGNNMVEEDLYDDALLSLSSESWEIDESKDALENACSILNEIGRCNMSKKTFTFLPKDKLKKKYMESMEKAFDNWKKKMAKQEYYLGEYQLRTDVREACGVDSLLYYNYYCHNVSALIADYLSGFLPEKLYIGTIVDCHR